MTNSLKRLKIKTREPEHLDDEGSFFILMASLHVAKKPSICCHFFDQCKS